MDNKSNNISGVLVVDKPAGPTSHDVVRIVKRIARAQKVGHLGTLDPSASGVLPLVINDATKQAARLAGDEKVYEFTLVLGIRTDTDDDQGRILAEVPVSDAMKEKLVEILPRFVGRQMQAPPSFSAIKFGGRRAYELAKEGAPPKLSAREVFVDSLDVTDWDWPALRIKMACRKGTYVRSLCRDLGESLGCGGHARAIKRLKSGPYIIDTAVTLDDLKSNPDAWKTHLIGV